MNLEEFVIHKTRWLNGFSQHMKLGNIDFKTYMLMNGLSEEEFDIQDSYDSTLDTWQDSTNSGETNIQDEV